jgi:hypothetical protein
MAFDIEEFKAVMEDGGILQTNKYEVMISFSGQNNAMVNSTVSTDAAGQVAVRDIADDLTFRCIAASLPGMALRTIDSNRFGVGIQEKIPFSGNYTDIDLTFVCDRSGMAYVFWYNWINYIFATGGATGMTSSKLDNNRKFYTTEYKDTYCAQIEITLFDTSGERVLSYNLYKAFPVALNDTPLSWSDNNNLLKVTAKISFSEWSIDDGASGLSARVQRARQSSLNNPNNDARVIPANLSVA